MINQDNILTKQLIKKEKLQQTEDLHKDPVQEKYNRK